jgi:hypothetical protein
VAPLKTAACAEKMRPEKEKINGRKDINRENNALLYHSGDPKGSYETLFVAKGRIGRVHSSDN